MADLILDPAAHSVNSEPIPYPVNKFTVYWEYIKYEAAYDRYLWRRFVQWFKDSDAESPFYWHVLLPYFLDSTKFNAKASGKRIVFAFFLPLILACLFALWLLNKAIKRFLCTRKTV